MAKSKKAVRFRAKTYGFEKRSMKTMNLIGCTEHCIYQKDGLCVLTSPAPVTRSSGCVHFVCQDSASIASRMVRMPTRSMPNPSGSGKLRRL